MKKFFDEFKKFITRGNVMDMAVGVIVGGAFTAIVNGLSNFVLKPIINWILALILGGDKPLSEIFTYLKRVEVDGTVDLANSIYIDWGSLINVILNFLIVAFVLFTIVRFINRVKDGNTKLKKSLKGKLSKEEKKELKSKGIKLSDKKAVDAYMEEKAKLQSEAEEKAKLEAEAKAKADREANPTTEDLLKQIRDLLKKDA